MMMTMLMIVVRQADALAVWISTALDRSQSVANSRCRLEASNNVEPIRESPKRTYKHHLETRNDVNKTTTNLCRISFVGERSNCDINSSVPSAVTTAMRFNVGARKRTATIGSLRESVTASTNTRGCEQLLIERNTTSPCLVPTATQTSADQSGSQIEPNNSRETGATVDDDGDVASWRVVSKNVNVDVDARLSICKLIESNSSLCTIKRRRWSSCTLHTTCVVAAASVFDRYSIIQ
jgi:hypothetical protein